MSVDFDHSRSNSHMENHMESLILAQNERWRRGLGMQVERLNTIGFSFGENPVLSSGERVSNT